MPFHVYKAWNEGEGPRWFGIHVAFDDDHWVSTCKHVDEVGNEIDACTEVAPKFYGVTAGQAHRRMLDVLENTYTEVVPTEAGEGD